MQQDINGVKQATLLKDVGYAPKCGTNLISSCIAQRAGVGINFEPHSTKMIAMHGV